tara:strand:- start:573 stop:1442 length:870 start_codon:yes stop_codon:yes gene_type:complete
MSNIFAMVTLKSSDFYTSYALKSFFKNTDFGINDEFLLINNDKCELKKYSIYEKINTIENNEPLSFGKNVNQAIKLAIKKKKDLIFLNNDIIFTENWFLPLKSNNSSISIPVNNQLFQYQSDCGNLRLNVTMRIEEFKENYHLLNDIVQTHKRKYKPGQKFQTLLMPFFCFKIPFKILSDIEYFDESFVDGGEDIDYRIRCAIKGYEVNFLIDSYLLHFHGKSTWDGNETPNQTKQRNEAYTKAFLKKWKQELTQIFIMRKDFLDVLKKKNLEELFNKRKFGELIRKLT